MIMNKTVRTLFVLLLFAMNLTHGWAIDVKLTTSNSQDQAIVSKMERNLTVLLNEINAACQADRLLKLDGMSLSAEAKSTLEKLWVVSHFRCCDEEVTDRLWNFNNSYMARSIPLIIVPDAADKWAEGTFQEAVVEFNKNGIITDFRFSFSSQIGESLEKCSGNVVDLERKLQIIAWCDRLATAYNEHNMDFMRTIFSDKALIITGKVITDTNKEFGTSNQKVIFSKQTKKQYLIKLAKCFADNKWIHVEFDEVGIGGVEGGCASVTQSKVNPNFYGVRLHQKYRSTNYSDDGYVFLLWNFTKEDQPQIEVRTWQPDMLNGKKIDSSDIISLGEFENDIKDM